MKQGVGTHGLSFMMQKKSSDWLTYSFFSPRKHYFQKVLIYPFLQQKGIPANLVYVIFVRKLKQYREFFFETKTRQNQK